MKDSEREAFVRQVHNAFDENGWQRGVIFRLLNELEALQKKVEKLDDNQPRQEGESK